MNSSPVFEWLATELEGATSLSRQEARGTVRIALREVGLTVEGVARRPMCFVLDRVLPDILRSRGVQDSVTLCSHLARRLDAASLAPQRESPEHVFARLGGDLPSRH